MTKLLVFAAMNLLAVSVFAASNGEAPTPIEPLKMINSNKGTAVYADKCSNGANATDDKTVREFIAKMEADPSSNLYAIEKKAVEQRGGDLYVYVADTTMASHVRVGCGETYNKLIATVQTQTKYDNVHDAQTQYIIVIKDTVESDVRTLELVDVKPFFVKSDDN